MKNSLISSVLTLVKDGQEHELYVLNQTYRFSYTQAKATVEFLSEIDILHREGNKFKLKACLRKKQVSDLYKLIRYRTTNLEDDVIETYRNKALIINSLYAPNLYKLDPNLIIDEKK